MRDLLALWLGRVEYREALAWQERLLELRITGKIPDVLLLLEHPPVITLGRGAHAENILLSAEDQRELGVEVVETGRGGDVTFHGPGQLVAYPIFDLKPDRCDVRRYVRDLGDMMIGLAGTEGIVAGHVIDDAKKVGVWVDLDSPFDAKHEGGVSTQSHIAKLGAIGVRISRWVTMHGLAINVFTDLNQFRWIIPCGIANFGVCSIEGIKPGISRDLSVWSGRLAHLFSERFSRALEYLVGQDAQERLSALLEFAP